MADDRTPTIGKFKGHDVITLYFPRDEKTGIRRRFTIGRRKAKLLLEYLDDVRAFAEAEIV